MSTPQEILDVPRPKNTVVVTYGKNKDLYAVRQRKGCKYENGRRVPIEGSIIGHIVNGEYVPITQNNIMDVSKSYIDLKDWANVELCHRLFQDIIPDLLVHYTLADAQKLYCIAVLRVCYHGIKDYQLKEKYDDSFLSDFVPNVALSKNTVTTFLKNLGKTCTKIQGFMMDRAAKVHIDHHLLIDGTLKTDNSIVNSLSDFSRKAKKKGSRDISIIYAFDLQEMEPVCSKCFPGNMLDLRAYETFLEENGITQGIIVADKGFPSSAAADYYKTHPDLHYLDPIRRNSRSVKTHDLHDYTGSLKDFDWIVYRKEKCIGSDKWLYSFHDSYMAAQEEVDWLHRAKKNDTFSTESFKRKQGSFGTIILESDLDIEPEAAYKAYHNRWEIELVMRYYKSACEFDDTREHHDYSVIGSEFCDFLATILTYRLLKFFDKVKLLEKKTYKEILNLLEKAKKGREAPGSDKWLLLKLNDSEVSILQDLDLLPKPDVSPKKTPGRPRKNP